MQGARRLGCSVLYLDEAGAPDALLGYRGVNVLVEIKAPIGPRGGASKDGQRLSPRQDGWHAAWRGQVAVVRTFEELQVLLRTLAP